MKKFFFRRLLSAICVATILLGSVGCSTQTTKYQTQFFGVFDTVVQVVGFARTEQEFTEYVSTAHARFSELDMLFDRFTAYEGVNNVHMINTMAGKEAVVVEQELLDLLLLCKDWHSYTSGNTNIAMGSVTDIWHGYMELYSLDSTASTLPQEQLLQEAGIYADIENIVIDKEKSTVFITDEHTQIDLGAVAKGYATQIVADELYEQGFQSFLMSAGGNVVAKGAPQDGRDSWNIGIQNPFADVDNPQSASINLVKLTDMSVVTSGDYERFYMVGDRRVHHIIDPKTLYPAEHYRGLTVVHEDSALADMLSTAMFCMDYETGSAFASEHALNVIWVMPDGAIHYSESILPLLSRSDIVHVDDYHLLSE